MTETLIDRLVAHVLDTPFEAFSDDVLLAGKKRLIDVMGCALSGVHVDGNDEMFDLILSWGGNEQAGVPGRRERLPLPWAAMLTSLQSRSFDFEVTGPEPEGVNQGKMVGHVGSTTEPVAVTVGQYMGSSGAEILAAVILGGDVAARISVSNTFDFDDCFEVCGTSNAFGAVAVAGRLMNLSHDELANAYGILLNLMAGSFQSIWDGVQSFKLPGAMAAFNGILACQMSQRGFGGVKDALQSRQGYFKLYTNQPEPQNFLADLGEVFYVHGQHKLHPSCYGNHNPIESALQIRSEHAVDITAIEAIELDVAPNRVDHFLNQVPTVTDEQPKSLFTIPYGIANALVRGKPELTHYVSPAIKDPEVLGLAERVTLIPNLPLGNNQASRLRVILADGAVLEAERSAPLGWLSDPTPMTAILDKYWRNFNFSNTITQQQAEDALKSMENLESLNDGSRILDDLALRVSSE